MTEASANGAVFGNETEALIVITEGLVSVNRLPLPTANQPINTPITQPATSGSSRVELLFFFRRWDGGFMGVRVSVVSIPGTVTALFARPRRSSSIRPVSVRA